MFVTTYYYYTNYAIAVKRQVAGHTSSDVSDIVLTSGINEIDHRLCQGDSSNH